jgi:hypothetical protein
MDAMGRYEYALATAVKKESVDLQPSLLLLESTQQQQLQRVL